MPGLTCYLVPIVFLCGPCQVFVGVRCPLISIESVGLYNLRQFVTLCLCLEPSTTQNLADIDDHAHCKFLLL